MNGTEKVIYREKRLLSSTDLSDKKSILQKHTNNIDDLDADFFKMVQEVVIEDQEAEVVRKLEEAMEKLKKENQTLLEDTDRKIAKMVQNLNEQVDDAKKQRIKITYEDPLSMKVP